MAWISSRWYYQQFFIHHNKSCISNREYFFIISIACTQIQWLIKRRSSVSEHLFNSLRPSDAVCLSEVTIIGSDNGFPPSWHQHIIRTNAEILLIGPLGTYFSAIVIEIYTFSCKKMHLKMSSGNGGHFVWPSDACMLHHTRISTIQIMSCRLFGTRPLLESMLA